MKINNERELLDEQIMQIEKINNVEPRATGSIDKEMSHA